MCVDLAFFTPKMLAPYGLNFFFMDHVQKKFEYFQIHMYIYQTQ